MPMNPNTFGVDTAFTPLQPPGFPPAPPRPDRHRNLWPAVVIAGTISALVASAAAALITVQVRSTSEPRGFGAPVTVTAAAPTTDKPAPMPVDLANRTTCQEGFVATQAPTKSAVEALSALPVGMKILDPAVQQNPEWTSAVRRAGAYYTQASEALRAKVAPGTTPVLAGAADTAVEAFRLLGDSYTNFAPIAGNAHDLAVEASDQMVALCTRLAP